jgi:serine/threonine protein kinase
MAETQDSLVGQNFEDRYVIEELLGQNEVSCLYRANQVSVQRSVAIRISHAAISEDPEKASRFETAAEAIGAIHHPNIINLIDFGTSSDGRIFLVREFIEGERLHQLMTNQQPMEMRRVLHIVMQILDALAEAHSHGIVHRDLNPRSIFIHQVGASGDFIKVFDFRIGIPTSAKRELLVSQDPHYMAPEQIRGEGVSPKTDLYAVGVLGYQLLTGRPPFEGADRPAIVAGHIEKLPEPPRVRGRILSDPLSNLIIQCLNKSPEVRPSSAADMLAYLKLPHHLDEILNENDDDTVPDLPPALPTPPPSQRRESKGSIPSLEEASIEFADEVEFSDAVDCELPGHDPEAFVDSMPHSSTPVTLFILAIIAIGAVLALIFTQRPETSVLSKATKDVQVESSNTHSDATQLHAPDSHTALPETSPSITDTEKKTPSEVTEKKLTDVPTVPPLPVSEVVTIETLPKGAFIFRGQEKKRLGETPFAYTFKEGEEKVRLRIWADGYETAKMILRRQDISTTRRVSLKKSFVKKQKKKKLKKKKDAPIPTSLEGAID